MNTQTQKPVSFLDAVRFSPVETKNELQHYLLQVLQGSTTDLDLINNMYATQTITIGSHVFPVVGLFIRALEELRAKGANEPEYRAWTQLGALSKRHYNKIEAGLAAEEAAKRFILLADAMQKWLEKNKFADLSVKPTAVGVNVLIPFTLPRTVKVSLTKQAGAIAAELKLVFQSAYDDDVVEATVVTFKSE